jgi:hypothetical protein
MAQPRKGADTKKAEDDKMGFRKMFNKEKKSVAN